MEIWEKFYNNALFSDVKNNRLAHTILLVGEDNFALEKFCSNLVLSIMCESENKPCLNCSSCKKILHNNNVDVAYYPKESKQMSVKEVEDFISCVYMAPYEADRHVFVLRDANQIDKNTQNKLLKILEEPPAGTYIILLASEEYNILPTIKSRARIVRVPLMEQNEIREVLLESVAEKEVVATALEYCNNNCTRALRFATDDNFLVLVRIVEDLCLNFKHSSNMLNFASKLYAYSAHFDDVLEIYLQLISRTIHFIVEHTQDELASQIANLHSVQALVEITKQCGILQEKFKRNCNLNGLVDSFLFMILEVRHKWPVIV